jgi:hypothetical protein
MKNQIKRDASGTQNLFMQSENSVAGCLMNKKYQ